MAGHIASSKSVEHCTPEWILDGVRKVFGGQILLDPCSNKYSKVNAKISYVLPQNDGLIDPWDEDNVYCNPPFGNAWWKMVDGVRKYIFTKEERDKLSKEELKLWTRVSIADWTAKCAHTSLSKEADVIAMVPVAASTKAWQDHVFPTASAIFFPSGRLHFESYAEDPTTKEIAIKDGPAPMDTCLIYWTNRHPTSFIKAFDYKGRVVVL